VGEDHKSVRMSAGKLDNSGIMLDP
jgi:hypothetical protein